MSKRKLDDLDWSTIDKSPVRFLVDPQDTHKFFSEVWEKGPKLYKATAERKALFPGISSLSFLQELLSPENDEQLEFGLDLNAARYTGGIRETPNGEVGDQETVMGLYNAGCTIQLHQPQRFSDSLWRLISALEAQLGCLVGANAYLTPAGTQGLAPHYDDVDLWVCQTEGSKRWRLYASPEGYELPAVSSKDFQQSEIGRPTLEVTLQVGDVLFMPRGTVHQAVAQQEASCHVTISTYQKWAVADFVSHLLQPGDSAVVLFEEGIALQELQDGRPATKGGKATPLVPSELRTGLPINFLASSGLHAGGRPQKGGSTDGDSSVSAQISKLAASGLRALAEGLEKHSSWVDTSADSMAVDFMRYRAPPHPSQLPDRGPAPTVSSQIQSMGKSYFRVVPCSPSQEVAEAYEDATSFVSVLSCINNTISSHMMGDVPDINPAPLGNDFVESLPDDQAAKTTDVSDEGDVESEDEATSEDDSGSEASSKGGVPLVFPESFLAALIQVLLSDAPLGVRDIKLRNKEEKLGLAYSLWEEGLVCTVANAQSNGKKHKS